MAWKRWIAAASVAVSAIAISSAAPMAYAATQSAEAAAVSPQLRATAVPGAGPYKEINDALLAADLNGVIGQARADGPGSVSDGSIAVALVADQISAGRIADAEKTLAALPKNFAPGVKSVMEPWVLLVQGKKAQAAEQATSAAAHLNPPLSAVFEALVAEAAGDLKTANLHYEEALAGLDLKAPDEDKEPQSPEEYVKLLAVPQTVQIAYRAALVKHRLGRADEAQKLYESILAFDSHSPDTLANLARLKARQQPIEPTLDPVRGLGRWSLFLSEEFGRTEGIAKLATDPEPKKELVSPSAALFGQLGVALDPSASDWALGAASTLSAAGADDGALRILNRIPSDAIFAPDARLTRAGIELDRHQDGAAVQDAQAALSAGGNRWPIVLASARVLSLAGRDRESMAAFDRAVAMSANARDKSNSLLARAGAHYFAGRTAEAAADGHAALAADDRADVRIALIGLLLDQPSGWQEAVQIGRKLLSENPQSSARLNQLGYTLIQRPEGLDEGYRLLSRGATISEYDYAVIDSLGWAYYQYGDFEQALSLVQKANELSPEPVSELLDHLGDIHWRLKQQDDAKAAWRKALEARPEARRKADLEKKLASGLTTPAPVKRKPPSLEDYKPGRRQDL